jgi:hypothetical protein
VASAWPTHVESLRTRLFDHMDVSTSIDQVARALADMAGQFDGYESTATWRPPSLKALIGASDAAGTEDS